MDLDAYIALDRRSPERWEYVNGEAWMMAGGSIEHNLVCSTFGPISSGWGPEPSLPWMIEWDIFLII